MHGVSATLERLHILLGQPGVHLFVLRLGRLCGEARLHRLSQVNDRVDKVQRAFRFFVVEHVELLQVIGGAIGRELSVLVFPPIVLVTEHVLVRIIVSRIAVADGVMPSCWLVVTVIVRVVVSDLL